jgi:replicative DNA helicase Mcm
MPDDDNYTFSSPPPPPPPTPPSIRRPDPQQKPYESNHVYMNRVVNYWYYDIGANVIPAITQAKTIQQGISWSKWQKESIPVTEFEKWKDDGFFDQGIGVICGKVHRGPFAGKFLSAIDADNKLAIEELCSSTTNPNGADDNNKINNNYTIDKLAQVTIVEQHLDNPDKAHIYFISERRNLITKSSDNNKPDKANLLINNEIPAFEIKGAGTLMFATPSPHKSGNRYQFIGTAAAPMVLNEASVEDLENRIDKICRRYGLTYLDNEINAASGKSLTPIQELFKEGSAVHQGNNRHEALMRVMESLLTRTRNILSLEEIIELSRKWNQNHCVPPLDDREFEKQWKCATKFISESVITEETNNLHTYDNSSAAEEVGQRQQQSKEEKYEKIYSVSDALRLHSGPVKVQGMITSLSQVFKMFSKLGFQCLHCGVVMEGHIPGDIPVFSPRGYALQKCINCEKKDGIEFDPSRSELINAVMVEIQDIGAFSEIERLHVFLFDDDTRNIGVGEQVIVTGSIHVMQSPNSRMNKKLLSYLFAKAVKYEQREQLELSPLDTDAVNRLKNREGDQNIISKLTSMFASDVIGHDIVKRGLLFSAVNSGVDTPQRRQRLNALLIGPPGVAKSRLLREATHLVPSSRFESGQSSSGKSLTAIVAKEDETYVLRLGPVPLAKEALLSLNEFGRLEHGHQAQLLDVMQEGVFTINKFGINATIRAPTTIIASANPIGIASTWDYGSGKIDFEEIPAMKPIIDRFDMIFIIRSDRENEESNLEYAYKKMELLENDRVPDYYRFLKRYILYAKRFNPRISQEARAMFSNFYKTMVRGFGSPRLLDTLINIAKAIARLKLKDEVDAGDATEALDFYNALISHHRETINLPTDPRDTAFTESLDIIKMCKGTPITRDELVSNVCQRKEYLKGYLTKRPMKLDVNKPLKNLHEMLINHHNIRVVNHNPTAYQWFEDDGGQEGGQGQDENLRDNNSNDNNNGTQNCNQTTEKKTDQTDRSDQDFVAYRLKNSKVIEQSNRILEKNIALVYNQRSERSERTASDSLTFGENNVMVTKEEKWIEQALIIKPNIAEQKHRAAIIRSAQGYPCVYCNTFESKYQEDYQRHILTRHPDHLPCPTDEELELSGGRFKRGRKE